MKAIILCAGLSSRTQLGYPKCLYKFKVGGSLVDAKLLPRKPPKNMDFDRWFDDLTESDFYIIFINSFSTEINDPSPTLNALS